MKNRQNDDNVEGLELKTVLEQKFRQLNVGNERAPVELKQEVFNTLNSLIMAGDLLDLFTVKFVQTELSFLDPSIREDWDEEEGSSKSDD